MPNVLENNSAHNLFDPNVFIGKEIGNITLISLLGRGAMGAVFIGYQKSLKRKVAVKIFPKLSPESMKMRLRFRDEAETVAVLNHPNIVPVFDMGANDELIYIIMQLIDGEDLRSLLKRHLLHPVASKRLLPLQSSLSIMIHILDALSYAHEEGVIHRDIKPANIIMDNRSNRPYLADFGIAQSTLSEKKQTNIILGTPLYISPEQVCGSDVNNRSDIYSSGVVLFELIAGKLPLSTKSLEEILKIKMYNPDSLFSCSPSAASPLIDNDLEAIIKKAIASNIEDRYLTSRKFHDDLVAYYKQVFPEGNK